MQRSQFSALLVDGFITLCSMKVSAKLVKKQRVNYSVDVFYRRIVHAVLCPRFRIQS